MQIFILKYFLLLIAAQKCDAVVTWKKIGCDGWLFKETNIDDIWDNAKLMAKNAQTQIGHVPQYRVSMNFGNARIMGANSNFLFGIDWNEETGTNPAGKTTMQQVSSICHSLARLPCLF